MVYADGGGLEDKAWSCADDNRRIEIFPRNARLHTETKGKENIEQIPNKNKIGKKEKFGFVYIIRNKKQEILQDE